MGNASTLYDLASRRFLVLEPDWTVGKVLDLLVSLEPEYALLPAQDDEETGSPSFYGATEVELELRLARRPEDEILRQIPDLTRHLDRLPTCDAYLPIHRAPEYCVVIDEGDVVGIWDADRNPGPWRSGEDGAHRLEVDHEPEVELGAELSLFVSLETDDFPAPDSEDLDVPVGSEIEIWVRPKRGFRLTGPRNVRLRVEEPDRDGDGAASAAATFRLRASELGVGRVAIDAFFEGQHLGRLTVAPVVREPADSESRPGDSPCRYTSSTSTRLRQASEETPDLSLTIHEMVDDGATQLQFSFHARGSGRETFGPFPIAESPHGHLQDLFEDLEDAERLSTESAMRRKLKQTGAFLFQRLLPKALQGRLWELKDRIDTVQISSDEVAIPWELCVLCGPEDGRIAEGEHFCEAFAITRWWPGGVASRSLSLCNMGVVAPSDTGLPEAAEEARYLLDRSSPDCRVERLPDGYQGLVEAFGRGSYGALHFTGHGLAFTDSGDRASIDLSRGECLRPTDLNGIASNVGLAQPLVFLNACRTGYGGKSLQGIGGWAAQFLRIGAGAFVGTLWGVRTRSATRFAEVFYESLYDGMTLGSAARNARCTVRDEVPDKTTWLAYTVFADPLAKVVRTEPMPSPPSAQGSRIWAT